MPEYAQLPIDRAFFQATWRLFRWPMRFPNDIHRYRVLRGWSQQEVARILGTSRGTVSSWERGQRLPRLTNLFALARLFGTLSESLYWPLYRPTSPKAKQTPR